MLDLVGQLLSAKAHVEKNPGASVTISLDLNDPNARKLAEFAKKLMLPTTKIHASGLVTKSGMAIPERADEFIAALRGVVGDEIMDDLATDLAEQVRLQNQQSDRSMAENLVGSPQAMGRAFDGILRNEQLRGGADVESLGNMVQELLKE
jgi:hypothetical protein